MDTLLIIILVGCIGLLATNILRPTPPEPQIIYVQTEASDRAGVGCLPLIIIGVLVVVILDVLLR